MEDQKTDMDELGESITKCLQLLLAPAQEITQMLADTLGQQVKEVEKVFEKFQEPDPKKPQGDRQCPEIKCTYMVAYSYRGDYWEVRGVHSGLLTRGGTLEEARASAKKVLSLALDDCEPENIGLQEFFEAEFMEKLPK